ncbi:MAG: hypothetical protein H0W89_00840 [Candidatus Levybacteria bacterium]|nr:hypothetical protein [Candidatus Levybacteria bacterium]
MVPSAKKYTLKFVTKEKFREDIYNFYFSTINDQLIIWLPGQYLQLSLPHDADERGTSRFFTIASAPTEKKIMLTIKEGESSFKKVLFALTPGETVNAFGPMGKFVLDGD